MAATGNPMHSTVGVAVQERSVEMARKEVPDTDNAKSPLDADGLRLMAVRKRLEFEIIKKFDKSDLGDKRAECFYLMDRCRSVDTNQTINLTLTMLNVLVIRNSKWLNEWSHFVQDPSYLTAPGAVSSANLLKRPVANALQAGSWGKQSPLEGLQSIVDYRGVSPLVYFIFVGEWRKKICVVAPFLVDAYSSVTVTVIVIIELYGRDGSSPDICRYAVDIYLPAVPVEKLVNIQVRSHARDSQTYSLKATDPTLVLQLKASRDAKIFVNKIRPQW